MVKDIVLVSLFVYLQFYSRNKKVAAIGFEPTTKGNVNRDMVLVLGTEAGLVYRKKEEPA